jgi:hypothetical protein
MNRCRFNRVAQVLAERPPATAQPRRTRAGTGHCGPRCDSPLDPIPSHLPLWVSDGMADILSSRCRSFCGSSTCRCSRMMHGLPERRAHDYLRHGITTLLAATAVFSRGHRG